MANMARPASVAPASTSGSTPLSVGPPNSSVASNACHVPSP